MLVFFNSTASGTPPHSGSVTIKTSAAFRAIARFYLSSMLDDYLLHHRNPSPVPSALVV